MSKRTILVLASILALALIIALGFYTQQNVSPSQGTQTGTQTETSSGPVLNLDNNQLSDAELKNLKDNLGKLLEQIRTISEMDTPQKPSKLMLTALTKQLLDDVGSEIAHNQLTATYASHSPEELMSIMGKETDIEKRIAVLAVFYYKAAKSTLDWGEAFTITPDSQNPVDALASVLRAKSMILTLTDAQQIMSETSTRAMLEKLLPMAQQWEANYKEQLSILQGQYLPAIRDVITAYYPLTSLMSAPQTTASQILTTLNATSGMTATTMGKPDILFLIYSAEHTRVAAETLAKVNAMIPKDQPIQNLDATMAKAWGELQKTLNITLPEDLTSTKAKESIQNIAQELSKRYGFENRDIGAFMVNMMLDDWRIYKTNTDNLRRAAATAEAMGILSLLTDKSSDVKNTLQRTFPAPKDPKTGFDIEDTDLPALAKLNIYLAKHIPTDLPLSAEMVATSGDAILYAKRIVPKLEEMLSKLNKDNYTSIYNEFTKEVNNLLKTLLIPTMNLQTGIGVGDILP